MELCVSRELGTLLFIHVCVLCACMHIYVCLHMSILLLLLLMINLFLLCSCLIHYFCVTVKEGGEAAADISAEDKLDLSMTEHEMDATKGEMPKENMDQEYDTRSEAGTSSRGGSFSHSPSRSRSRSYSSSMSSQSMSGDGESLIYNFCLISTCTCEQPYLCPIFEENIIC